VIRYGHKSEIRQAPSRTHFLSPATASNHPGPTTGRFSLIASWYCRSMLPPRPASSPPVIGVVATKCVVSIATVDDSLAPMRFRQSRSWSRSAGGCIGPKWMRSPVRLLRSALHRSHSLHGVCPRPYQVRGESTSGCFPAIQQ